MEIEAANDEKRLKKRDLVNVICAIALSLLFDHLGVFSLLALAPLLVIAAKYGKKKGVIVILITFLCVLCYELADFFLSGNTREIALIDLAFDLYIPLSLSAAGIIWLYTDRLKLVGRLIVSILPATVIVVMYCVIFVIDRALWESVYAFSENAFAEYFGPYFELLQLDIDLENFFYMVVITVLSIILPIATAAVCANCFVYETVLHSRESDWEERVVGIEFSTEMVWGFIISWALILLFSFMSIPIALEIIVLNIALLFAVLYSIQGFSVVYAWLLRSMPRLKSFSLFIVIFILATVVPGINIIVLIALPVTGLLENFFNLKKIGERRK